MSQVLVPDNWAEFVKIPQSIEPGLYVTSLPIGHARDITLRALDLLAGADVVACEDQRVTARICAIYGLSPKFMSYHDHNAAQQIPALMARLRGGAVVALVTDAGTPLVSDPGYRLVRAAIADGLPVFAVPGPSAVLAALVVSGLATDRFLFAGFPPAKSQARRRFFEELVAVDATLVLFEAPHRIAKSLADLAAVMGARACVVGRELTKKFEEVVRGPLHEVADRARDTLTLKGEFVVLVEGAPAPAALAPSEADGWLKRALAKAPLSQAVDAVALVSGLPRRQLYQRALELTGAQPGHEP